MSAAAIGDGFTVPLYDLGEEDTCFAGILAPEPERGMEKTGITNQFLEEAGTYHDLYTNSALWRCLLEQGLGLASFHATEPRILDIGSGSGGNSVVPLLQLFPQARITATDLSPNILAILKKHIISSQVQCVCLDVGRNYFKEGHFDLAFGGAILHHIIEPEDTLKIARHTLKQGGIAIFSEPFEAGHAFLATAFRRILERGVETSLAGFLKAMLRDWDARIGRDKSAERFKHMDDKWLFTKAYVQEAADRAGLELVGVRAHDLGANPFRAYVTDWLLPYAPRDALPPEWAWAYINELDLSLSEDMKQELLFLGTIVLRKS